MTSIPSGVDTDTQKAGLPDNDPTAAERKKDHIELAFQSQVAAAALDLPTYDRYSIHLSRIPAEKVHSTSKMFLRSTQEQRAALGYMHPGRVDVISAGSLVLSRIMHATGATEFIASESDILDGMAWSLAR